MCITRTQAERDNLCSCQKNTPKVGYYDPIPMLRCGGKPVGITVYGLLSCTPCQVLGIHPSRPLSVAKGAAKLWNTKKLWNTSYLFLHRIYMHILELPANML